MAAEIWFLAETDLGRFPKYSLFIYFFIFFFSLTLLAHNDLFFIPDQNGFVSTWLVSDITEKNITNKENWQLYFSKEKFSSFEIPQNYGLHLFAVLKAKKKQQVYLGVGTNAEIAIKLNDNLIFQKKHHLQVVSPDEKLVALALNEGENLLRISLKNHTKNKVIFFSRFMDNEFLSPRGLLISLPGNFSNQESFKNGNIFIERLFSKTKDNLKIYFWLDYKGGRPWKETDHVFFENPDKQLLPVEIDFMHPGKSRFLLGEVSINKGEKLKDEYRVVFFDKSFQIVSISIEPDNLELFFSLYDKFKDITKQQLEHGTYDTLQWNIEMLESLLIKGDSEKEYIKKSLETIHAMLDVIEAGVDPYSEKVNELVSRAYFSPLDQSLVNYALYVPPNGNDRSYGHPLVIVLHGQNGNPNSALTMSMGFALKPGQRGIDRIRNPGSVLTVPFFVAAPDGFGNSGYQGAGEQDILAVIEDIKKRYSIDPNKIFITGNSMGGTGAARMALRYPGMFAFANPLCGYHNLNRFRSIMGKNISEVNKKLLDWESNYMWAPNALGTFFYAIHGKFDSPRSSIDLINAINENQGQGRIKILNAGHRIWDETYKDGWLFDYLSKFNINDKQRKIKLKSNSLRYANNRWISVGLQNQCNQWFEIEAHWTLENLIEVSTKNIKSFTIQNNPQFTSEHNLRAKIDNTVLPLSKNKKQWFFTSTDDGWLEKQSTATIFRKNANISGPITDIWNEPLLFVYSTNPREAALTQRLAQSLKIQRPGVSISYKVKADAAVTHEDIRNYSLVLIGTPSGNSVLNTLKDQFPFEIGESYITMGEEKFVGDMISLSFIYPNPENPDRYVLVHTGTSPRALFYTNNLPRLLPDYIMFNGENWASPAGIVAMEEQPLIVSGFFDCFWQL